MNQQNAKHPAHRAADRLLTVSNRGPKEFRRADDGKVFALPGQGGLSTALSVAAALMPTTWLASPMTSVEREIAEGKITPDCASGASRFVASDPAAYDLFYGCFANEVLWFLQHGMPWPADLTADRRREAWVDGYATVNEAFAEAIVSELDTGAYKGVMLHDYHFYLAPLAVRKARPDVFMQHFVHIPWPGPDEWERLEPDVVKTICEGVLANDSLVFQTEESVRNFLDTCAAFLPGALVDAWTGQVQLGVHTTRVWSNGISIDPAELEAAAASPEFSRYRYLLRGDPGQKTIVRVDRMDPSKNILAGFEAYALLLEEQPELRGKVNFIAHIFPSRSDVPMYRDYQEDVLAKVEEVNKRYGSMQWKPIRLMVEHNRMQALAAMSLYDVLLVNPIADGMNLVAKEGPMLNRHNGVLVLSRTAGAYAELGCGSLGIEPRDVPGTAQALYEALAMPAEARQDRARRIRQKLRDHDLRSWLERLITDIDRHTREPATAA